jgi:phosphoribosylanthranilate isomerase
VVRVKVCGITHVDDAVACRDAAVDALGLNFWAGSPRRCELEQARRIVEDVGTQMTVVAVFVDESVDHIREVVEQTGVGWVQLHGDEPPEDVHALLPRAYKALRVRDAASVQRAARYPGEHVLLDAAVPGRKGGTGTSFDWDLALELGRERKLTLAGGLGPDNVAQAVTWVKPYCVDVASGVESRPGRKDPRMVQWFVEAAKGAVP